MPSCRFCHEVVSREFPTQRADRFASCWLKMFVYCSCVSTDMDCRELQASSQDLAKLDQILSRPGWGTTGFIKPSQIMSSHLFHLYMRFSRTEFPNGFSERHCLRAMNFARVNGHVGCKDLISKLSGIPVDKLETDEYCAPWIAY